MSSCNRCVNDDGYDALRCKPVAVVVVVVVDVLVLVVGVSLDLARANRAGSGMSSKIGGGAYWSIDRDRMGLSDNFLDTALRWNTVGGEMLCDAPWVEDDGLYRSDDRDRAALVVLLVVLLS